MISTNMTLPVVFTVLGSTTSVPLERNSISLDPTFKDDKGRAAMRMTYMDHDDDLAMATFLQDRARATHHDHTGIGVQGGGAHYPLRPTW